MRARIRQGRERGFQKLFKGVMESAGRPWGLVESGKKGRRRKKRIALKILVGDSEIPGESDLRGRECRKLGVGEEIQMISSVWGH